MGILDEAIKEHLELKRQHGAGVSELKKLEDEAFGQADRPGAEEAVSEQFSEAPTEFMSQPAAPEGGTEAPADLEASEQETRLVAEAESQVAEEAAEKPHTRRTPLPELADLQEAPPAGEPAEEEAPAMEHTAIAPPPTDQEAGTAESEPAASAAEPSAPEPESPAPPPEAAAPEPVPSDGPSTEERHAIAEQPTEHYDIEQELASAEPGPSEEQLVEEEISEPRLAPVDPLAALEGVDVPEQPATAEQASLGDEDTASASGTEEDEHEDDFFDEKRLSDELDQALESPAGDEADESEIGGWHTEEHEAVSGSRRSSRKGEDVLDETPDFLEEAPEDDQLWFEQKPPKDFDFDD